MKWKPIIAFSYSSVLDLLKFGWKVLGASIIFKTSENFYGLVIGKIYGSANLGYYNKGNQFPQLITTSINGSIASVMLPVMSQYQDNPIQLKSILRRTIKTSSFLTSPIIIGLALIAEPLIITLLTSTWAPAILFLQINCIVYFLMPINTACIQAIYALGRSGIVLKLELLKNGLLILGLIISIPLGIYYMALFRALVSIIMVFINFITIKKNLDYKFKELGIDVIPAIILSLLMGLIIIVLTSSITNYFNKLVFSVIIGMTFYIVSSFVFNLESKNYLYKQIRNLIKFKK